MTEEEFTSRLAKQAIDYCTSLGYDVDCVVASSLELLGEIDGRIYLGFRFYRAGEDYASLEYMPITFGQILGVWHD